MRLPPPEMRYSAMSVMTPTLEADWRRELPLDGGEVVAQEVEDLCAVAMESVLTASAFK